MLSGLRLKNFKCFADTGDAPLAPLTPIFGKNNSGKSTVLHSILLLRQTIDAGIGAGLSLDGPLYAAGGYSDLVHQHQAARHIEMSFSLQSPDQKEARKVEMEFSANEPNPPRLTRLEITFSEAGRVALRRGRGAGGPFELFIGERRVGRAREAGFHFVESRFFPFIYPLPEGTQPLPEGTQPSDQQARNSARRVIASFENLLLNTRTVGAFRKRPERRYDFHGVLPGLLDVAGENVVAALIEDATRRRAKRELARALNRWLAQIGRVRLLPIRRLSPRARIFELRLRDLDSGRWANFADMGFGIGQAFPVLVEGLRTPRGGILLVQEPEIHLHPDAQLAMADFLVDLVESGRQVVVETHSENILLRVRSRLLKARRRSRSKLRLSPEAVQVLYVDKATTGESTITPLQIDALGQVVGWPAGFMEEATKERLAVMRALSSSTK